LEDGELQPWVGEGEDKNTKQPTRNSKKAPKSKAAQSETHQNKVKKSSGEADEAITVPNTPSPENLGAASQVSSGGIDPNSEAAQGGSNRIQGNSSESNTENAVDKVQVFKRPLGKSEDAQGERRK